MAPLLQTRSKDAALVEQLEQANAMLTSDNARLQQQLEQATGKVADSERMLAQANSQLSSTMAQLDSIKCAQKASEASHGSQVLDLQLALEQLKAEQQKVQPSINALQESNKMLKKVRTTCKHLLWWFVCVQLARCSLGMPWLWYEAAHVLHTSHWCPHYVMLAPAGAEQCPQQGQRVRAAAWRG